VGGQERDIFRYVSQGRCLDVNDLQAKVQVRAKCSFFDRGFQVLVRSRNHSHIDCDWFLASDSIDGPFLQHPQDLGLGSEAQIADLVWSLKARIKVSCHSRRM
jgi:hypothetical protein